MSVVSRKVLCTAVFGLVAATAVPATAAPVDCARPPDRPEARACEAARMGVDELRQFIWRKRAVFMLYINDFEAAVPARVADAHERPVQPKAG
ncbi:MAG: hypothetical protein IPM22_12450 [Betaproteobacteria bacterium]|nr:hypothetical protein [Betaproteobacteria bacterium]MCC7216130.1 hypothetical protein [Burkholderiales bacterium]